MSAYNDEIKPWRNSMNAFSYLSAFLISVIKQQRVRSFMEQRLTSSPFCHNTGYRCRGDCR